MMACHSLAFPEYALELYLLHAYSHSLCWAEEESTAIKYKKLVCLYALWQHCPFTKEERKSQLTSQKGEVPVVLDAGYLQVAHDYLTVLIVFAQGSVMLLQVGERAQFILCACTHCQDKKKHGKLCKLCMTGIMIIFPSTLLYNTHFNFLN